MIHPGPNGYRLKEHRDDDRRARPPGSRYQGSIDAHPGSSELARPGWYGVSNRTHDGGLMHHHERHRTAHIGWLRASVLGANDGLISTASLIVGVAASGTGHSAILVAGVAGLVAGSMSMAAGEYVSVSSQADTESAAPARERHELDTTPAAEKLELSGDYRARGPST